LSREKGCPVEKKDTKGSPKCPGEERTGGKAVFVRKRENLEWGADQGEEGEKGKKSIR